MCVCGDYVYASLCLQMYIIVRCAMCDPSHYREGGEIIGLLVCVCVRDICNAYYFDWI